MTKLDRLTPGMCVVVPAEVLHEIPQGVVLGLHCGQCVVVPADAHATNAQVDPARQTWEPPREGDVVLDPLGHAWQYKREVWYCADGDGPVSTGVMRRAYGSLTNLTLLARDGRPATP